MFVYNKQVKVAAMDESSGSTLSNMEQTASLLNHNVSFNSSMELTRTAGEVSTGSIPDLSFSLSESERRKLLLRQTRAANSTMDLVSKANGSTTLEQSSWMEDDDEESENVISIEDTMDEHQHSKQKQPEEEYVNISPPPVYFERQLIELGRRCWPSSAQAQHYTKGCYWSPDGTCLLVPVHLDGMHVMELPLDLYEASNISTERSLSKMQSAVHVPEGGTVYDCVWYPLMNSQEPESCFWLATRQHEPIHMWDAFDGRLRCSYSGYDEVDEVVAAISLQFANDGQKIYAGYKRCIKIFDTSRPGRRYDEYPVKFAISCMAQNAEYPHTVTCGNWRGYIQHFDLRCPPKQGPLFTLGGHSAGITQLRYGTDDSNSWQLFSGARKCPKLLQWDMRNYNQPMHEFQRQVNTNQRIQFDLCPQQSWLASGDTDGNLNLWNLADGEEIEALQLPLHDDCCNGIGFHPSLPILASSSGQYHFIAGDKQQQEVHNNTTVAGSQDSTLLEAKSSVSYENAVLLLWCGPSTEN
ncbi:telomerase Cajal body protein 1 homolog [Drosophila navojoa]|uniref:telomerase Cajal body protein 1 homolog n=1 Tax=Drosophila navojoa TaxID=7232 RepID=UPI0011BDBE77|nr:telomerase Cajal body protein 1 homolog [Drosophila navojoa]